MLLQHTLYEPENFPPHKHKELHTTTETYAGVTVERWRRIWSLNFTQAKNAWEIADFFLA